MSAREAFEQFDWLPMCRGAFEQTELCLDEEMRGDVYVDGATAANWLFYMGIWAGSIETRRRIAACTPS